MGPARRLLLALGVVVVAVSSWAAPAFGHAQLQSTDPASGTVLPHSPGTVVLHFGEAVEIQFGAVRVFDSASHRVDTGNAYHPHGDGKAVAVDVPTNLGPGGYVVTWRVISADSHPVHGAFTFLIGSGGANSANATRAEAARLLATSGGSRTVGVLFGAIRFLSFAALFVLVGGAAFLARLWPDGRSVPRARWLLRAGLVTAIGATALSIALQGPYGGGLGLAKTLSPTVISDVLRTRFGEVYLARLVLLVLAVGPLIRRLEKPEPLTRWWLLGGAATGAALLVTPGLAGHAATGSLVALAVPFDLVHVSAAAVWVGGLAMLAVAVLVARPGKVSKDQPNLMATVVPGFSQWALAAVGAIAVSGGFAAWRQIGSLSAVTTTSFGRLVLVKTIVFVVLVGVASKSRRLVHRRLVHRRLAIPFFSSRPGANATPVSASAVQPRSPGPGAMAAPPQIGAAATGPVRRRTRAQRMADLRRAVLLELVLAAVIIAVSALLVNAQPARQALNQPFSAEVRAGPNVLVDVVVDPAKAGPVAIHLYTLSADGAQLDVPDVTATLSLPAAGVTNLAVPLQKGGTGHFLVAGFQVPLRGTWTLNITVRTTAFDEFNAAPIKVRMR